MAEPGAGPASGVLDGAEHVYRLRVYFEDTDAGGVVYHANYLRMAERARTEMMRLLGIDRTVMARAGGLMFAVRDCAIEYLAPARLDDVLEIRTGLVQVGGASLRARQCIRRGGDTLARIRLRLACVTAGGRPARFPGRLRSALAGFGRAGGAPPATQRA